MMFRTFKSRSSYAVLAMMAACFLAPASASASASFMPVHGWTVGSTELASVRGLGGVKLPCVLSAEYDNGFVIRFSGGGNQMLALAIDFRQNVFNKGQKYNAVLSVGNGYVKQISPSAFTASTLIFNLRDYADFYTTLKSAPQITLDIEGNSFDFSLQQMAQNLGSLEACYTTGNAAPIQPVSAPAASAPVVPPAPQPRNLPRSFDDIMKASPEGDGGTSGASITPLPGAANDGGRDYVAPIEGRVSRVSAATSGAASTVSSPSSSLRTLWRAQAGEDLHTVLSRWSATAGYDLQWQASDNGKVVQDMAVTGRFEDAVAQLLAENRAGTGIKGRFDDGRTVGRSTGVATSSASGWSAAKGADLRSVLNGWAQQEGVQIIWQTSAGMPSVKSVIRQSGSFESAVQALLDQYADDSRRPVAQLNIDPVTKKRTLSIDLDQAS